MKYIPTILILLGCSVLLAGCNTTSHVTVGRTRPAILESQVKIYIRPPAKYEEIAILDTNSLWSFRFTQQGHMDAAINRLKGQAAKLGANGVLLSGVGSQVVGSIGNTTGNATAYSTANATAYRSGNMVNAYGTGTTNVYGSSTTFNTPVIVKAASGMAIYVTQE